MGEQKLLEEVLQANESRVLCSLMILVEREKKYSLMAGVCHTAISRSHENYLQAGGY